MMIISKEMIPNILLPLSVSKVFGVGKKTVEKLNNVGIFTVRDLYKFPTAKSAREEMRIHQCPEHTQAHESFYTGPILVGLRKTEKLEYLPYSCYHADLVNKIVANPSLMIVGYSFGDLYVNQLLERHKLVHGKNQRVVLIDVSIQPLFWWFEIY